MTTTQPSNQSELQLYRVLQRANLLQYFDTFIAQGGDDVQQLCEAGEEEFLEIMALVGMASKPLHVRRLQKALQEWVTNPVVFQQPIPSTSPAPGSITASVEQGSASLIALASPSNGNNVVTAPTWNPQPAVTVSYSTMMSNHAVTTVADSPPSFVSDTPKTQGNTSLVTAVDENSINHVNNDSSKRSSPLPTPVLVESQIKGIADAAAYLARNLPPFELKPMNMKKQISKEIESLIAMPRDNPNRLEEMRKYAAIYGRFDSKRKNEKPMSLHEISVNEAAAQLCMHIPALLTRREDLFPLARQVVRDSGYQYSKGHSRAQMLDPLAKKPRLELGVSIAGYDSPELEKCRDRLAAIIQEGMEITKVQEEVKVRVMEAKAKENYPLVYSLQTEVEALTTKQLHLLSEQSDIMRKMRRLQKIAASQTSGNHQDGEDTDSSYLPTSGSSSPQNSNADGEEPEGGKQDSHNSTPKRGLPKSRLIVQETLFEEGLRIAQQYGLGDFEEELKGMKGDPEDEVDEQQEWNMEIENDIKAQKTTDSASENGEPILKKNGVMASMPSERDEKSDTVKPAEDQRQEQASPTTNGK